MLTWLVDPSQPLPDTRLALGPHSEAPGLLAAGGELTPRRLAEAYRRGIFPWYSEGQPVLWWSPDPRMVLPAAEFRLSHSLRKTLRRFVATPGCELRVDTAFARVIAACAGTPRPGQRGTWIQPELLAAYTDWHKRGAVHSFETWVDGRLVGGLYGVGVGRMFFGESMFSHATDSSKVALAALVAFCRVQGIELIDCQQRTEHLASLGAREIPRHVFEGHLARAVAAAPPSDWTYHRSYWTAIGVEAPASGAPAARIAAQSSPLEPPEVATGP